MAVERRAVYSKWYGSHALSRDKKGAKDWLNKWKPLLNSIEFNVCCLNLAIVLIMSSNVRVQTRQASRGKPKSSSRLSSSRGKGKSTPSSSGRTTRSVSSTRASSSKRRRVDGSSDGEVEAPLTRKDIPVIVKAVMDAMPGAATHQPLDDADTVERPGELDDLCCKNSLRIPFCVHARVRG